MNAKIVEMVAFMAILSILASVVTTVMVIGWPSRGAVAIFGPLSSRVRHAPNLPGKNAIKAN